MDEIILLVSRKLCVMDITNKFIKIIVKIKVIVLNFFRIIHEHIIFSFILQFCDCTFENSFLRVTTKTSKAVINTGIKGKKYACICHTYPRNDFIKMSIETTPPFSTEFKYNLIYKYHGMVNIATHPEPANKYLKVSLS